MLRPSDIMKSADELINSSFQFKTVIKTLHCLMYNTNLFVVCLLYLQNSSQKSKKEII
jgi:hypothetical protein